MALIMTLTTLFFLHMLIAVLLTPIFLFPPCLYLNTCLTVKLPSCRIRDIVWKRQTKGCMHGIDNRIDS